MLTPPLAPLVLVIVGPSRFGEVDATLSIKLSVFILSTEDFLSPAMFSITIESMQGPIQCTFDSSLLVHIINYSTVIIPILSKRGSIRKFTEAKLS